MKKGIIVSRLKRKRLMKFIRVFLINTLLLLKLATPGQAVPLILGPYQGTGDVTLESILGGTLGIEDGKAVTTRIVADAFSNGSEATPASNLKTFLGFAANPNTFNRGSTMTATYINVQSGDLLQFTQSNVDLGTKPDLTFLVTFYDLVNDQLSINPLPIDSGVLQTVSFPGSGSFLVGFSLIQTGGSTARVTVTLAAPAPEINLNCAALPAAISLGGLLLVYDSRRRRARSVRSLC